MSGRRRIAYRRGDIVTIDDPAIQANADRCLGKVARFRLVVRLGPWWLARWTADDFPCLLPDRLLARWP